MVLALGIGLLSVGISLGTGVARAEPSDALFTEAAPPEPSGTRAALLREDPRTRRSRPVQVRSNLLRQAGPVLLNLFADVSLRATGARSSLGTGDRYAWHGQLEGVPHGRAIFVVDGRDVAGNIVLPGASYQIRPAGSGLHVVREIDPAAFPDEAEPATAGLPVEGRGASREGGGAEDDGSQIDVLVVYTAAAAGGSANIEAEIQLAIEETNSSYANSQIGQRLHLVGTAQVDYAESRDVWTDLNRLTNPQDGALDEVHALRDESCADLVSLWVENDPSWCGVAWLMTNVSPSSSSYGFSVVRRDCATGLLTFGHELGHNMGAHHDRYVDPQDGAFPYSHGFINTEDQWRTIMAYNTECSVGGFSCTRIPHWSNPEVLYAEDPTGVPWDDPDSADNALTLDSTAWAVANFRPSDQCCAVTDPNHPDSDCDGALDDADVCTLRNRFSQTASKSVLLLKHLERPAGEQGIAAKGFFNPASLVPDIEPDVNGANFRLEDANGVLFEVNLPGGGPANPPTLHCGEKDGWTRKETASGRAYWIYRNRSGALPPSCGDPTSANGISRVVIRDLTSTRKNAFRYIVQTRDSVLARTPAFPVQYLQADLALAAQPSPGSASAAAVAGQCAETVFSAPASGPPSKPYCKSVSGTGGLTKILCKGP